MVEVVLDVEKCLGCLVVGIVEMVGAMWTRGKGEVAEDVGTGASIGSLESIPWECEAINGGDPGERLCDGVQSWRVIVLVMVLSWLWAILEAESGETGERIDGRRFSPKCIVDGRPSPAVLVPFRRCR